MDFTDPEWFLDDLLDTLNYGEVFNGLLSDQNKEEVSVE